MSTPFRDRVMKVVLSIPRGTVTSYGFVATLCGSPRAARAVGSALRTSEQEVPWQRVINSAGRISFKGDVERASLQRELLHDEGLKVDENWALTDWLDVAWDGLGAPTFFDEQFGFDSPPDDWEG
ncbi:MAG: methylated-DNA-protein-cysteine methyltransferase-like protein [Bradymonadia bacterium]|jgi:methylated-DNA-protein-cysteine methyltransferase-like protein